MRSETLRNLTLACATFGFGFGFGCGDGNDAGSSTTTDPSSTTGPTSSTTDVDTGLDSSTGQTVCFGAGEGTAAVGDACTANSECESGVCTLFSDAPVNDDAVCAQTPPDCATRFTGTAKDFATREPLSGIDVRLAGAIDAISNPVGAEAIVAVQSGDDGRFDVTSDMKLSAPIAVIALLGGGDFALTATGATAPSGSDYPVANGIHEFWAIPSASLTTWSDALAGDPEIAADALPLGEQGGVVGLVRDGLGNPVADAVVSPSDPGSAAIVRHLADDDTFTGAGTGSSGIFVVIGAQIMGENFQATVGGSVIATGTAGQADGVVFSLLLDAP